jgi:hypothetical protein
MLQKNHTLLEDWQEQLKNFVHCIENNVIGIRQNKEGRRETMAKQCLYKNVQNKRREDTALLTAKLSIGSEGGRSVFQTA